MFQNYISWDPPGTDGGLPVIGYFLEYKYDGSEEWAAVNIDVIKEAEYKMDELPVAGRYQYEFRVCAENSICKTAFSPASDQVKMQDLVKLRK